MKKQKNELICAKCKQKMDNYELALTLCVDLYKNAQNNACMKISLPKFAEIFKITTDWGDDDWMTLANRAWKLEMYDALYYSLKTMQELFDVNDMAFLKILASLFVANGCKQVV